MDELTELEVAVLDYLLDGDDPQLALRAQRQRLRVTKREYTGVGFYTDVEVPADASLLPGAPTLRFGDVIADIDGLQHGAGFILFVDAGRITMLEGYLYGNERWPATMTGFRLRYEPEPRDPKTLR